MKTVALVLFATVLTVASVSTEQTPAPAAFPLTVDSIMRGPELVGNPPNNLRWSGDSQSLYFDWLMPKEGVPSTWVVGRSGGEGGLYVVRPAGAQRPRLARLAIGLVADVMRLEKLMLFRAVDAALDRAELVIVRPGEAMTERDIAAS